MKRHVERWHRFEKFTPGRIDRYRDDAIIAAFGDSRPACWKAELDYVIWECERIFGFHSHYSWYGNFEYRPSEGYVPTTYFEALHLACWDDDGNDRELYYAASFAEKTMQ